MDFIPGLKLFYRAPKMRKIRIECGWTNGIFAVIETRYFTDWYDFADWMKQQHLKGMAIAVYDWQYVDG